MGGINMQEFLRAWRHSMSRPIGAQSTVHDDLDFFGGFPGGKTQRARKRDLVGDGSEWPVNQFNLKGSNTAFGDGFQSTWSGNNSLIGSKYGHQRNFKGRNFLTGRGTDSFQSSWFGKNTAVVGGKSAIEQRNYKSNNTVLSDEGANIKGDQSTWHGENFATGPKKGKYDFTQRTLDGKNTFVQGDNSSGKSKQIARDGESTFIGGNDSTSDHTFKGDKNRENYFAGDRSTDKVKIDGNNNNLNIDTKDKDDHVSVNGKGNSGTINTGDGNNDQIDLKDMDQDGLNIKDKDGAQVNYGDGKKPVNMDDHFRDNEYKQGKDGSWGWHARGGDNPGKSRVSFDGDPTKYRHNFGGKDGPMSHQDLLKAQQDYLDRQDPALHESRGL